MDSSNIDIITLAAAADSAPAPKRSGICLIRVNQQQGRQRLSESLRRSEYLGRGWFVIGKPGKNLSAGGRILTTRKNRSMMFTAYAAERDKHRMAR
jgi:hypothetical protein